MSTKSRPRAPEFRASTSILSHPVRNRTSTPPDDQCERAGSIRRITLTVGLRLVGVAGKRGVIPRLPTADDLMDGIERQLRDECADAIVSLYRAPASDDARRLRVRLHPAAREVEFTTGEPARVSVAATTVDVGPGYHTYLAQLVRRIGTEQSITWDPPSPELGTADDTGYFDSGRREDAERRLLIWLRDGLNQANNSRRIGGGPVNLQSTNGHRYDVDGRLVTALGPRDDQWLDAALTDPNVAIDVWPWWTDALDARHLLNRALTLMWTEIRWRPPATDEERAVMSETLKLLRRALPLDTTLAYPWREWRELLAHSGTTDPMADQIAEKAAALPAADWIGYRRRPVTVTHAGWSLKVPGSFAERRTTEEWWGGEGGRAITLAATPTETDGRPMLPDTFLKRVAGHLGTDVLRHQDGPIVGAARLTVNDDSGVETAVLEGYSAVVGSGAAIKIEIHDPNDWEWALDMWRSLRPAA
jgi:hypothetical protein